MPGSWVAGSGTGTLSTGSYSGPICPQPLKSSAATIAKVANVLYMSPVPIGKAGDYTAGEG